MKYITRTKGVQKKKQETILLARVSQKKKKKKFCMQERTQTRMGKKVLSYLQRELHFHSENCMNWLFGWEMQLRGVEGFVKEYNKSLG